MKTHQIIRDKLLPKKAHKQDICFNTKIYFWFPREQKKFFTSTPTYGHIDNNITPEILSTLLNSASLFITCNRKD